MANPDRQLSFIHQLSAAITSGAVDGLSEDPQGKRPSQGVSDSWRDRVETPEAKARIQRARKQTSTHMTSLGIPRIGSSRQRPKS